MEGGSLQQAWRVQQGLPVYGPPSPDFVPFLYTPLYPYLLSVLGRVFPLDYALGRGVSILAVFATCAALWWLVRREHKPRSHAAMAVGLFLAGYVFSFRWLDVARGDALFLALLTWGLALLRHSERPGKLGWRRAVLAGLLVAAAFWTKQTAFVFVLASGLVGLLVAPRQVWAYAGTIALVAGGGVLLGQWLTEGWLWTWIYETHQSHAFNAERFRRKTWGMFLHAAPFLAALSVALAGAGVGVVLRRVRQARRVIGERRSVHGPLRARLGALWLGLRACRGHLYWASLALAALVVSALGYATQFAEPNAFIPGVCFGAALLGVAVPDATQPAYPGLQAPRRVLELAGLTLIAAQLIFALAVEPIYQPIQDRGLSEGLADSYAWQDPRRTLPGSARRQAAARLRETIERTPSERGGELLALHRAWWPILAGGRGHVGAMGINDVSPEQRRILLDALREDLAAGRFSALWIDGGVPPWLRGQLSRGWSVDLRLRGEDRVRPMSGWMSEAGMVTPWRGEQLLLVRQAPREVPEGVEVIADFESGRLEGFELGEGAAFGRNAARTFEPGLPPFGPHGGARLLSSVRGRNRESPTSLRGEVRSPVFSLPEGGALELLLGSVGTTKGLAARLVFVDEGEAVLTELPVPDTGAGLEPVRWRVPPERAGARVRLVLIDASAEAGILADDLWLWSTAPE
nr:glycosyltransferase family 39 protein [Pseudenhygromyxa sp. WMMC2535]